MPHDKQDPTPSSLVQNILNHRAQVEAEIKAPDPMAAAGVRIAEAIQKLVAHEDPTAVLLALGLQIGATVARQSPPDLAQGMSTVHTVARVELKRRRPGLRV